MKKLLKWAGAVAIIFILFFSLLTLNTDKVPAQSKSKEPRLDMESDTDILMKAFESTQGHLEGCHLNFWSEIKNKEYTQEEMQEVALGFVRKLMMEENAKIQMRQEEGYTKVMVMAERDGDTHLTVVMESLEPKEQPVENYFLVDLSLGGEYKDIAIYETITKEYFQEHGFDFEHTMTIIGSFSEKMNIGEMKDVLEHSFQSIDGEVLEGIEDTEYGGLVSLSGYSPRIKNSLPIGGKTININAAMRFNEYDNKSYYWIGTPLIATDY